MINTVYLNTKETSLRQTLLSARHPELKKKKKKKFDMLKFQIQRGGNSLMWTEHRLVLCLGPRKTQTHTHSTR